MAANDGYLVYNHAHPDGDALGSAIALVKILRHIGKKAFAYSPDGIPAKLDFLPYEGIFVSDPEKYKNFIPLSVDLAGPKLLGKAEAPRFALSFDHHLINTLECDRLCLMNRLCSCGEMIFLLADEMSYEPDADCAAALYTAICSDSGGFRYSLTSAQTHRMAARLHEKGIDFAYINRRLFESKTRAQTELIKFAYNNLRFVKDGKFAYVAITVDDLKKCGADDSDVDCVNDIPRSVDGVLASAVIRERGDGVKVSLRSSDSVDVAAIASRFGGGGHYHAAGLSLDCKAEEAAKIIERIFSEIEV